TWRSVGAAIRAASTPPASISSSSVAYVRRPVAVSSSRTAEKGSTTTATWTSREPESARRWVRPMRPAPTIARRTGSPLATRRSVPPHGPRFHYLDTPSAWWYGRCAMRLGVVLEAFLDRTFDDTLALVAMKAPQVTDVEVGVGGFAPHPHCDVELLLHDATSRRRWVESVKDRGFGISALNASGNPLDPDEETARRHDTDLRNAVRLAALLDVDRVVAMAGCPPGAPGDRTAHFDAGGWLPHLAGI